MRKQGRQLQAARHDQTWDSLFLHGPPSPESLGRIPQLLGLGNKEGSVFIGRMLYVFSYLKLFLINPHSFLRLAKGPGSGNNILFRAIISFSLIYAREDKILWIWTETAGWVPLGDCPRLIAKFFLQ